MSRRSVQDMLQECLAAYDAGLSPEECLSAWPEQRDELEPLLREALLLRIAFGGRPGEEFQARLRERLLFHSGREVRQALAVEPDAAFVARTRNRLRYAAGAAAQEALRAVPPPRLAFWINARRRFLEAAARPRPSAGPLSLAVRSGVSAAFVAVALAVALLAYVGPQSGPRSASAELAAIEQALQRLEEQRASGQPVPAGIVLDVTRRVTVLVERVNTEQTAAPLAEKLQPLIERNKDVVSYAAAESPVPALREAQEQLTQAEERIRVLAARSDVPALSAPSTAPPAAVVPATAVPAAPVPAAASLLPTPAPLGAGQLRIGPAASDTTFGMSWVEVSGETFQAVLPATWSFVGVTPNAQGVAVLNSPWLRVDGPRTVVLINVQTGQIDAIVDERALVLRQPGVNGKTMGVEELVAKASAVALEFHRLLDRFVLIPPGPSSTP